MKSAFKLCLVGTGLICLYRVQPSSQPASLSRVWFHYSSTTPEWGFLAPAVHTQHKITGGFIVPAITVLIGHNSKGKLFRFRKMSLGENNKQCSFLVSSCLADGKE